MSAPTNAIESNLVENRVFPPSDAVVKAARISGMAAYEALCNEANTDFEGFGPVAPAKTCRTKPFTQTLDESNAPVLPLVWRRRTQRQRQLPGQAHWHAGREQDRHHV